MKILILEKFDKPSTDRYQSEGEKMGHIVTMASYRDVIINLDKEINIKVKDTDLKDFNIIYLRTLSGHEEMATLIAKFAKHHKITLFDEVLKNGLSWIDSKSYELFELCRAGIPIIPTTVAVGSTGLANNSTYPLIIKRGSINQGNGVFLCQNETEAQRVVSDYPDEVLIFEPFLKNDGDLRVLVVDSVPLAAMHRSSNDQAEFRNNVSLGGKAEQYPLNEKLSNLSISAAKAVGYDIAGVDLILNQNTQEWLVMEVNRSPQYKGFENSTGINVIEKIVKFLTKASD